MEQMLAHRQPPHHLADLHQTQAYDALRPPCRVSAAADTTLPLVRKRRDNGQDNRRFRPTTAPSGAHGRSMTQSGTLASLEVAEGERDGAGGDDRGPDDAGDEVE